MDKIKPRAMQKSYFLMSSLAGAGFLLSLLNQILISHYYGTTSAIDSYYLTFSMVQVLTFYLGPMKEALIPEYHRLLSRAPADAHRYFSEKFNLLLVFCGISLLVMLIFRAQIAGVVVSAENPHLTQRLPGMFVLMSPMIFLFPIADIMNTLLAAYRKVLYQNIGRIASVLTIAVFLVSLSERFEITALAIGAMAGQLAIIVLQFVVLRKNGFIYHLRSFPRVDRRYAMLSGALFFSYAISQIHIVVEKRIFSGFGEGVIAAYQYAFTLTQVPQMIFIASFSLVIWQNILGSVNSNKLDSMWTELESAIKTLAIILGVVMVFCILYADQIIYVLFFRGAFGMDSITITSRCLAIIMISLVPAGISVMISRSLISMQRGKALSIIGSGYAMSGIACLLIGKSLQNLDMAFSHIVIASLVGSAVSLFFLYRVMGTDKRRIFNGKNLRWSVTYILIIGTVLGLYPNVELPFGNKIQMIMQLAMHGLLIALVTTLLFIILGVISIRRTAGKLDFRI